MISFYHFLGTTASRWTISSQLFCLPSLSLLLWQKPDNPHGPCKVQPAIRSCLHRQIWCSKIKECHPGIEPQILQELRLLPRSGKWKKVLHGSQLWHHLYQEELHRPGELVVILGSVCQGWDLHWGQERQHSVAKGGQNLCPPLLNGLIQFRIHFIEFF